MMDYNFLVMIWQNYQWIIILGLLLVGVYIHKVQYNIENYQKKEYLTKTKCFVTLEQDHVISEILSSVYFLISSQCVSPFCYIPSNASVPLPLAGSPLCVCFPCHSSSSMILYAFFWDSSRIFDNKEQAYFLQFYNCSVWHDVWHTVHTVVNLLPEHSKEKGQQSIDQRVGGKCAWR